MFLFYKKINYKKIFHLHWQSEVIAQIIKKGTPIGLQVGCEYLTLIILTQVVALLGIHALADYQIVNQYLLIATIPVLAFAQACAMIAARSTQNAAINPISMILVALVVIIVIGMTMAAVTTQYAPFIVSFFQNQDNQLYQSTSAHYLRIAAIYMIFDGIKNVFIGLLRGYMDTVYPMLITLILLFGVNIPFSYYLSIQCHTGLNGIIWSAIATAILANFFLSMRAYVVMKKIPLYNHLERVSAEG